MSSCSRSSRNALRRNAALLSALALTLAACSKGAPEPTKPRAGVAPPTPRVESNAVPLTPEANEALLERLARQEAATKLFEKSKPEPAPVAKAAPVEAPTPATAPAKRAPAPAPVKAAPAEVPKPAPTQVATAAPAPAPAPTPEPGPAASAIAPAKLVSRVDVEFPREAIQAGVDRGVVKARMTLDGDGNVTKVEVVESSPRRVFDRAVIRSLVNWRFNEGPAGRTVEAEVEFKR